MASRFVAGQGRRESAPMDRAPADTAPPARHTRRSAPEAVTRLEAARAARHAGLVHVRDGGPGFRRERAGEGFRYRDADGRELHDEAALARIRALAIPPAYEDVWISANPRGHLQATGRDARGRKQYRYHAQWRAVRDGDKFDRMADFGRALPRLKRRLQRDLAQPGFTRDKVLAAVVGILMETRVRVGNDVYAEQNGSFGLTTLRNHHLRFVRDGGVTLRFRGKAGKPHEVRVGDRRLVAIVRHCHQLPGQRLFQYLDAGGERHPVDSDLVNAYLAAAMGGDFTAKDFRTWSATLEAIERLAGIDVSLEASERARKRCEKDVVAAVADSLRNTPTVCRKSYINPAVFAWWRDGVLQRRWARDGGGSGRKAERVAIALLGRDARSRARVPMASLRPRTVSSPPCETARAA